MKQLKYDNNRGFVLINALILLFIFSTFLTNHSLRLFYMKNQIKLLPIVSENIQIQKDIINTLKTNNFDIESFEINNHSALVNRIEENVLLIEYIGDVSFEVKIAYKLDNFEIISYNYTVQE